MTETNYLCPVCKGKLVSQVGSVLAPGDPKHGYGVHCPHLTCPAQEVMGHGNTEKAAYETVVERFKNLV